MRYNDLYKWLSVFAIMSGSALQAQAERISAEEARSIAMNFLASNSQNRLKAPGRIEASPVYAPTVNDDVAFYVFNNPDNSGYTIISGDNDLVPVIGYSTAGAFDFDNLPPAMKELLDGYTLQIGRFYGNRNQQKTIIKNPEHPAIEKLLKSTWGQKSPYNDQCPYQNGSRTPTGCAATAAAQVMYYHQWPPKGVGTTVKGLNISNTEYRWDLMKDQYYGNENTESKEAVATLMAHIGSAMDMDYDHNGSGATDNKIHTALLSNFDYNPGLKYINHTFMSDSEWDEAIYNELKEGRPVVMTGYNKSAGHCFVVDGFDGNGYYHLNWGWTGSQDGFFLLNGLNPSVGGTGSSEGGYNLNQGAFTFMYPAGVNDTKPQIWMVADDAFLINSRERNIYCDNEGIFYNPTGRTISGTISIRFESIDGLNSNYSAKSQTITSVKPLRGLWSVALPTVKQIPDGKYRATLWLSNDDNPDGVQITPPYGIRNYIDVNIERGVISAASAQSENIIGVSGVYGFDEARAGNPLLVTARITNAGEKSFKGNIDMKLLKDGNVIETKTASVSLDPDSSSSLSFLTSKLPSQGDYEILFEKDGKPVSIVFPLTASNGETINYGDNGLIVSEAANTRYEEGVELIKPSFTIQNTTSQDLSFSPTLYLYDKDFNEITSSSVGLYLPAKKSTTDNLILYYSDFKEGTYYLLLKSSSFGNISPYIPVEIYLTRNNSEVAYEIISHKEKTARIVKPASGYYSGTVTIPEKIEETFTVTEIDPEAFKGSSEVREVSIPSTVKHISTGTFFKTSVERLTIASDEAPTLSSGVFDLLSSRMILLQIPDGTANKFARTEGWDSFHIPAWTFNVAEGLTLTGLQSDPETGATYSPYYVGGEESLEVEVSGNDKIFAVIDCGNGETVIEAENGHIKLPVLGLADGRCNIVTDPSGVSSIESDKETFDIFNLQGVRLKHNATKTDVNNLTPGAYIISGQKILIK